MKLSCAVALLVSSVCVTQVAADVVVVTQPRSEPVICCGFPNGNGSCEGSVCSPDCPDTFCSDNSNICDNPNLPDSPLYLCDVIETDSLGEVINTTPSCCSEATGEPVEIGLEGEGFCDIPTFFDILGDATFCEDLNDDEECCVDFGSGGEAPRALKESDVTHDTASFKEKFAKIIADEVSQEQSNRPRILQFENNNEDGICESINSVLCVTKLPSDSLPPPPLNTLKDFCLGLAQERSSSVTFCENNVPFVDGAGAGRDGAGAGGDPHIKTWTGKYFDFHGQCDLVLLNAPSFDNVTGLIIHIQTELRHGYSFINQAAVAIGTNNKEEDPDVLIVSGWGQHMINGVSAASLPYELAGKYTITHEQKDKNQAIFTVDLGDNQKLELKTWKDWVSVSLDNASKKNFGTSSGLMGQFGTGAMLSRDRSRIIKNPSEFGQHYQVLESEPKLFSVLLPPQHPHEACIMPDPSVLNGRRRLGETIAQEAAEKACSHHDEAHQEICVADVMMSGDLEVAQAGAF